MDLKKIFLFLLIVFYIFVIFFNIFKKNILENFKVESSKDSMKLNTNMDNTSQVK